MSTLTLAQRRALAAEQNTPYGRLALRCDGRRIGLQMQRRSGTRLNYEVMTYIDGEFKGAWMMNEGPESKFLRRREKRYYPESKVLAYEKKFGKKALAKNWPEARKVQVAWWPYWPNFLAALNHLCKVCESVEVIGPEAD